MDNQGAASLATGLSDALKGYLGGQIQQQNDIAKKSAESDIDLNKEVKLAQAQHNIDNPSSGTAVSYLSPEMAEKALPGYGSKMVQDYNQRNPNAPLTLDQGSAYISKAHEMLQSASPDTSKEDNHQDTLEKQAMDRITQVRGDNAIQRTELQRDAAAMAYETLAKAKSENRPLNNLELTDMLGQLWQARTGKAPTDSDMKAINEHNVKQSLNHAIAYVTNDPNVVGATSDATTKNLEQFITSTGLKSDEFHDGYMKPRLIKPTKLEQDRWDRIVSSGRGLSFADHKQVSDTNYKLTKKDDLKAKQAALRAKLGI